MVKAASLGHTEVVKYLVERGVEVESVDNDVTIKMYPGRDSPDESSREWSYRDSKISSRRTGCRHQSCEKMGHQYDIYRERQP